MGGTRAVTPSISQTRGGCTGARTGCTGLETLRGTSGVVPVLNCTRTEAWPGRSGCLGGGGPVVPGSGG